MCYCNLCHRWYRWLKFNNGPNSVKIKPCTILMVFLNQKFVVRLLKEFNQFLSGNHSASYYFVN